MVRLALGLGLGLGHNYMIVVYSFESYNTHVNIIVFYGVLLFWGGFKEICLRQTYVFVRLVFALLIQEWGEKQYTNI